jgi:enamine deaminase RidA (YjgF/YER057c/UK114 family)
MSTKGQRRWVGSGTKWEDLAGYARAVRVGDRVLVSGTTAMGPEGLVGAGDPAAQARFIVKKIETALTELGASLKDVVRTRIYLNHLDDWEAVARVHGEVFRDVRPVNTLVEARLIGDEFLLEMEAEAVIGSGESL